MPRDKRIPWKERSYAIGISSTISRFGMPPTPAAKHNLLFDVDRQDCFKEFMEWVEKKFGPYPYFIWLSTRGIHGIVLAQFLFEDMITILEDCPYVDKQWVKIGRQRGHLFLAESRPLAISGVTYMELWRDLHGQRKERTQDTRLVGRGVQTS